MKSQHAAEFLVKFGTEDPKSTAPCKECGQIWMYHFNADCPKPKAAPPVVVDPPPTWDLAVEETSLSGSPTPYRRGHIRVVSKQLRLQGRNPSTGKDWEDTSHGISGALVAYISGLSHTCVSIAGTGTTYVPCRFRRIGAQSIRVQIAGPSFNRDWGVEFDLSHMIHAPIYIGKEPDAPPPTSTMSEVGFLATFAVGDKVVVVVQGDGCGKNKLTDGCTGGPKVGTLATVKTIGQLFACGSVKIVHGDGDIWSCTPAHLAHVAKEPCAKPGPLLGIDTAAGHLEPIDKVPQFAGKPGSSLCLHCGKTQGSHYPGAVKGSELNLKGHPSYSPSACPDLHVCPLCKVETLVPQPIHVWSCPNKADEVPF